MRFSHDRRGQSVVIGTVILFGFLILALSLYQVQVVPQQNAQTEFEHFEEVRNDLVELRNGILSAGSSERPQFVDVKLGTNFQTRLFAINPPDPAGTLQTSQRYNITITDEFGETENISTRFVRYRPGYNEIQVGSTWYDNSVLYLDEQESGDRAVIIEDQNLVVDNDTLRITALQNEFQASGTRRVSLELYPANNATNLSDLEGELNVTIPTRLGADDGYWNESIETKSGSSVRYGGIDDNKYNSSDEVSALYLDVNSSDNITVNSVGIQSEPAEGAVGDNVGPVGGGDTDSSNQPEIRYVADSGAQPNKGEISFELENVGTADATITGIRIDSTTDSKADRVNNGANPEFSGAGGELNLQSTFLEIGAPSPTNLDTNAQITQGSTETFNLQVFRRSKGDSRPMKNEDVTITIELSDGTRTTLTIEIGP